MKKDISVYELNRIQRYMMQMRPVLKKDALFSDGTSDYRKPAEPKAGEKTEILFRTGKNNVDIVWLCSAEDKRFQMKKKESDKTFDYYTIEITLEDQPFYYYFEVASGLLHVFYDRYGVSKEKRKQYLFCINPGFSTPEWAKGAVMYQILVDRFYNGDPTNDVLSGEYYYIQSQSRKIENWSDYPSALSVGEFYGGDLEGVRQKLDYLQNLGVEVIYFNPLFVSPSNHKYDIQDYDYIDPHYGKIVKDGGRLLPEDSKDNSKAARYVTRVTEKANLEASNKLFAELVEEIHARGMKVIMDGVFNHCGSFNKWMDREKIYHANGAYKDGAFLSEESPYKDFFRFKDEDAWPDNASYEGWWDYDTLPKLNYEGSKELYDYILRIGAKWVSPPYNADGWRLDVAADLGHSPEVNHQFWKDFRKAVKAANPNAIILAEHYGDPKAWLAEGDQWDTVMNYDAFMEPVTWFLTGMEKHSDEYNEGMYGNSDCFIGAMKYHMASFYAPSLMVAMNELSNHDHSRFLTRTNHKVGRVANLGSHAASENINKAVLREAVVMQMTWPGAPTVYYGDEAGVCGFTDPDNRRTYPWGNEDKELIEFHKEMIAIHKGNEEFIKGSLKFLANDYQLLCYGRFTNTQRSVIAINNSNEAKTISLSVWELGISRSREIHFKQLIATGDFGYSLIKKVSVCKGGVLQLTLPSHGAVVLRCTEYEKVR